MELIRLCSIMTHIPSICPYSTETVVSSNWFFHFPALIFLSFGFYTFFVCVYNVHTSLFLRNKIIHCLISRRVSEKIDSSLQMLHENGKLCCRIEKQVISGDLVKKFAFVCFLLIGIGQGFLFRFQNRMYFLDHSKKYSINLFLSLKVSPHKFIRAYHFKV